MSIRLTGRQLDGFNAAIKTGDAKKVNAELQKAALAAEGASPVGSSALLAAVVEEIEVLDKEIELMQLRVNESKEPYRTEMLRSFGSCLWRHKRALEKAIAANND